jgi:hypothetical protein
VHIAIQDLGLESLDVIHTGDHTFPLSPRIRALPISHLTGVLGGRRRVQER